MSAPPLDPISFIFMQFLATILQNYRFLPQREGRQPPGECPNILFGKSFAENCIKMNEIGPRGGLTSLALPLDPPLM